MASTIYYDHAWFLAEVARLQTLVEYAPVNETAAALMVGEDTFERWDSPVDIQDGWSLGEEGFGQITGPLDLLAGGPAWTNAEGADGRVSWFPTGEESIAADGCRMEEWSRIH